jgi:hypothetical protein
MGDLIVYKDEYLIWREALINLADWFPIRSGEGGK